MNEWDGIFLAMEERGRYRTMEKMKLGDVPGRHDVHISRWTLQGWLEQPVGPLALGRHAPLQLPLASSQPVLPKEVMFLPCLKPAVAPQCSRAGPGF